jgi:nitric oxide reductase NorE protein
MGVGTAPPAVGTSPIARHLPGDKDVWVFIIAELLMFGVFFAIYIVNRFCEVEMFNASQLSLNRNLGVANTFFLVTSLTFRTSRTQFGANFVASPAGERRLPGRRVA